MNDIFKSILMDNWENIMKYLEFNGDINICDKYGRTPLIHAVSANHFDTVLKLIEYGANVNLQDTNGFSALHFAAQNNFIMIAKVLLDSGSKVDLQNISGNTPLFTAVYNESGNADMINLLISYGADNNLKNNNEVSPFNLSESITMRDTSKKSKLFRFIKILLIVLPIMLVFGYIWGVLNGTPWGKYYVKKEALIYLEHKYGINNAEFKILNVEYDFKLSTIKCNHYDVNLSSVKMNTKFTVSQYSNKGCEFSDDYVNYILGNEVEPQFKEFIDNVYSNKETIIVRVGYKGDYIINKIPSFEEIKNIANVDIRMEFDIGLKSSNEDLEIGKMMKIIEFLKNKGFNSLNVTFLFKGIDSKVKYLTLEESDLLKIQNADNLKTIIKQKYDKF